MITMKDAATFIIEGAPGGVIEVRLYLISRRAYNLSITGRSDRHLSPEPAMSDQTFHEWAAQQAFEVAVEINGEVVDQHWRYDRGMKLVEDLKSQVEGIDRMMLELDRVNDFTDNQLSSLETAVTDAGKLSDSLAEATD